MKKEQMNRFVKLVIVWALLMMLCLFLGYIASLYSLQVVMSKDYTQEETIGIISHKGFPIWYHAWAPGGRVFGDFHPIRLIANWGVWTAFFLLIGYGLRCLFAKIPVWFHLIGIVLLFSPLAKQMSFTHALFPSKSERKGQAQAEAIGSLTDKALLAEIAESDKPITMRRAAKRQLYTIRSEEIRELDDQTLLAEIAKNDTDRMIRKEATSKLTNQVVLADIIKNDGDEWVSSEAKNRLSRLRYEEVRQLDDQTLLAEIAENDEDKTVRQAATGKLDDQATLERIAKNDTAEWVRVVALNKLNNQKLLEDIAKKDSSAQVRLMAVWKLNDKTLLKKIAESDEDGIVRRTAVERLEQLR